MFHNNMIPGDYEKSLVVTGATSARAWRFGRRVRAQAPPKPQISGGSLRDFLCFQNPSVAGWSAATRQLRTEEWITIAEGQQVYNEHHIHAMASTAF